jgi:hypothetical protein
MEIFELIAAGDVEGVRALLERAAFGVVDRLGDPAAY